MRALQTWMKSPRHLISPLDRTWRTAASAGGRCAAGRRHQLERHVVEREQYAVGAVAGVPPRRRAREQRLIGQFARRDIANQNDDMIEPGDHGKSPRVFFAARTFSTPIAMAAVR